MIWFILHFKSNLPTTGIYIYCVYCILQYYQANELLFSYGKNHIALLSY